jgi:hypothetical protein
MPRTSRTSRKAARRTKVVWGALAASMSLVTGLLMVVSQGAAPSLAGLTLSPMVSVTGGSSIETVFATRAAVEPARWDAIVIHHSASPFGSPKSIEDQHRRGNLLGLGYHFVIGNGAGMGEGDIHVGYRWLDQQSGAHAIGPDADTYNRTAIGICIVGDGNRRSFSDLQVRRLAQLVATLSRELGIPQDRILLQRDIAESSSPGRYFPEASFRQYLDGMR